MAVAADVFPGVFPNPEECKAEIIRVFEPAPYCKLAYDGPLRGARFFAAFAVPRLAPGCVLYLKKRRVGCKSGTKIHTIVGWADYRDMSIW